MIVSESRFNIIKNSEILREMYQIDEYNTDDADNLLEDLSEILSEDALQTPEQLKSSLSGQAMPISSKEKGTVTRGSRHSRVKDVSSEIDSEPVDTEHESITTIKNDLVQDILKVSNKMRSSKNLKGVNTAISKIIRKYIKRTMAIKDIDEQEVLKGIGFIIASTSLGFSSALFGKKGKEVYDEIVSPLIKQMDKFLEYSETDGKRVLEFNGYEFSKKFGDPNKIKRRGKIRVINKSKVGIHIVMNHIHKKIVDMAEEHDIEEFEKKAQMLKLLGLGLGIIIHGVWSGLTVKYVVKAGEEVKEENDESSSETDTSTNSTLKNPEQLKTEMNKNKTT